MLPRRHVCLIAYSLDCRLSSRRRCRHDIRALCRRLLSCHTFCHMARLLCAAVTLTRRYADTALLVTRALLPRRCRVKMLCLSRYARCQRLVYARSEDASFSAAAERVETLSARRGGGEAQWQAARGSGAQAMSYAIGERRRAECACCKEMRRAQARGERELPLEACCAPSRLRHAARISHVSRHVRRLMPRHCLPILRLPPARLPAPSSPPSRMIASYALMLPTLPCCPLFEFSPCCAPRYAP